MRAPLRTLVGSALLARTQPAGHLALAAGIAAKEHARTFGVKSRRKAEALKAGAGQAAGVASGLDVRKAELPMAEANYVASTEEWMRRFVIKKGLCPYAAGSTWQISVHEDISVARVEQEIDELVGQVGSGEAMRFNRFIVWPKFFDDMARFNEFVLSGGPMEAAIPGSVDGTTRLGSGVVAGVCIPPRHVVAMPFHPECVNPALASPYPMLHLIPMSTLMEARLELGRARHFKLLERNERILLFFR